MNYIGLGVWAFAVLTLIVGILLGLRRGSRRAILRLSLVLVSVVVAFLLKDLITNDLLAIETGVTDESGNVLNVQQYIISLLPAEVQKAGETIVIPLIRSIVGIVVFLVLFSAMSLVTWAIVFPICKIFVKPKAVVDAGGVPQKNEKGKVVRKKHAGIGSAVGAVQGLIVALCVCIPVVGLLVQSNRVLAIVDDLQQTSQTQSTAYVEGGKVLAFADDSSAGVPETDSSESDSASDLLAQLRSLLGDFENTAASKFFYDTCRPIFDVVSTVKVQNADGTVTTVVLSKQITALKDTINLAKPLLNNLDKITVQLQDIQSATTGSDALEQIKSLTAEDSALRETFEQLDEAKADLSDEQKEMVNDLIVTIVDSVVLPESVSESAQGIVDSFKEALSETNFTEVDFTNELDVISKLTETLDSMQNDETLDVDTVYEMINEVSESTLILPVLEQVSANVKLELTPDQQAQVQDVIDQLPDDTNEETLDIIKNFLGL